MEGTEVSYNDTKWVFDLANKKGSEENPERMQDEQSTNKVKKRECVLWLAEPNTQHLVTGPGATFFLEPCQTRLQHPPTTWFLGTCSETWYFGGS